MKFSHLIPSKDMNAEIIKMLFTQYGIQEIVGENDNVEVLKYFREIGFKDSSLKDETAWCSAFANWIAMKCGLERSGKLNARSWLDVGYTITVPEPGDIVVFWRESPSSWKGHVAFFINKMDDLIYVFGGNQNNKSQISPYPESSVLGYRRLSRI